MKTFLTRREVHKRINGYYSLSHLFKLKKSGKIESRGSLIALEDVQTRISLLQDKGDEVNEISGQKSHTRHTSLTHKKPKYEPNALDDFLGPSTHLK